jgi:hypothetical protein
MNEAENRAKFSNHEFGVYCLANDNVIEWFEAFIRSFRKRNPVLPLTVIPYDKSILRLHLLKDQFTFTIMDESECSKFDSLAVRILGTTRGAGMFRKYACFFGEYNQFIFLDSDIVVLSSLDYVLEAFSNSTYDFLYFDGPDLTWVYKADFALKMVALYGSQGFSAGAFVSKKRALSEVEIFSIAESARDLSDNFAKDCVDQPFLNYVFDVLKRRVVHVNEVLPDIASSTWARSSFHYERKIDIAMNDQRKTLPFIHWAGCSYPGMVRKELFLRWRTADLSFVNCCHFYIKFHYIRWRRRLGHAFRKWRSRFLNLLTDKGARSQYIRKLQQAFQR